MELKVWVEGIQRIVCGVTEKTTCQDVVYALAHATGKTGRFTLIERWRNNERLLAPQEHPLKVLNKWGEYSQDVQFILQRSALDGMKNNATGAPTGGPMVSGGQLMSPQLQRSNFGGVPGPPAPSGPQPGQTRGSGVMTKAQSAEPPAVWKPPPQHGAMSGIPGSSVIQPASSSLSNLRPPQNNNIPSQHPVSGPTGTVPIHRNNKSQSNGLGGQSTPYPNDISSENVPNGVPPLVGSSRLSPDSGRGSDKTGSDTSNTYSDKDNPHRTMAANASASNPTTVKNSSIKIAPGSNTGQNPQQATKPSQPSQNPSYHATNGLPPSGYGVIQRSASATQMAWNRSVTPSNPNIYTYENNQPSYQTNNMANGVMTNNMNQNNLASESPYGFSKQSSMPVLNHNSQQYLPPNSSQHHPTISSSQQMLPPPAYRPPPGPQQQAYLQQTAATYTNRNSSPADPPPYRDPPPPPGVRFRGPMPSSPTNMSDARLQSNQNPSYRPHQYQGHQPSPTFVGGNGQYVTQTVRPPHYSPPPTHRVAHLSRHPSKSSLMGPGNLSEGAPVGSRNRQQNPDQRLNQYQTRTHPNQQAGSGIAAIKNKHKAQQQHLQQPPGSQGSLTDMSELLNLVTAQQSTLQSQQADIRQYETEESTFDGPIGTSNTAMISRTTADQVNGPEGGPLNDHNGLLSPGSQLDMVLSEVRRLEEMSNRNDDELKFLGSERAQMDNQMMAQQQNTALLSSNSSPLDLNDSPVDENIRGEILQLKHRLAGTDIELQRTNTTLRRLGDEMKNMSLEKTRQREQELVFEIERLQSEIKSLQHSSEDSANISQQLSKDVKEVEDQIRARKAEVEQLIREMREANMESLAISPPEESKQFLDGPSKPGTTRQMMGSPRQLENAVPTTRNPHGVWV